MVTAVIALLAAILFPAFAQAREAARKASCLSNLKQLGSAARMYMDDYEGALYHHHEQWVLDDGTQVESLPATVAGCSGGGAGNSNAEKPWAIFFQPYLKSRQALFCPSDPSPRSPAPATNIQEYNGGITELGQECSTAPDGEQCRAERQHAAMWSYLLNSIFTHRSCRYALEGVLPGFATDPVISALPNPSVILFAERNSEALDDPNNTAWGYLPQDDFDSWPGEAALVRSGAAPYANQGWIKNDRHAGGANYLYVDGHARWMTWGAARSDLFPDHVVRRPLPSPPP